jgi:hypothetical protein
MDTGSKSPRTQRLPDFADAAALWQSAFKGVEQWMRPDAGALEGLQGAAQAWMTHRVEDFQKAIEASRKMAECRDFAEAAAIQQKWLAESTERLVADWTALMTRAVRQSAEPTGASKKAE